MWGPTRYTNKLVLAIWPNFGYSSTNSSPTWLIFFLLTFFVGNERKKEEFSN